MPLLKNVKAKWPLRFTKLGIILLPMPIMGMYFNIKEQMLTNYHFYKYQ